MVILATKVVTTDADKNRIVTEFKALLKSGLSQEKAAEKLGRGRSTIVTWMNNGFGASTKLAPKTVTGVPSKAPAKPVAKAPVVAKKPAPKPKVAPTKPKAETDTTSPVKFTSIVLKDSIVLSMDGNSEQVPGNHPKFLTIKKLVEGFAGQTQISAGQAKDLRVLIDGDIKKKLVEWSQGNLMIKNGLAQWKGKTVPGKLQGILISTATNGDEEGLRRFGLFLDKVNQAISWKVTNRLYDFLAVNNLAIDKDGDILAYKVITKDWKDKHTGKFDNSIGVEQSCERNAVDDRDDVTCSNGFHACSFDYIKTFRTGSGDRLVIVKIDPRDFVSVPIDYNSTKARVCRYKVVKEIVGAFDTTTLAKMSVSL